MEPELDLPTQASIEESIISNLPICFGKSDAVEAAAFNEKYDSVSDYAVSASSAYLSPETTRYQTMLFTFSLLLLALSVFRLDKLKILDNFVRVGGAVIFAYIALIVGIAIIFLCKAALDYRRARFVTRKNSRSVIELKELLDKGLFLQVIQNFFWLAMSRRIAEATNRHSEVVAKLRKETKPSIPPRPQLYSIDKLDEMPELKEEIDRLHAYASQVFSAIEKEETAYARGVRDVLSGTDVEWEILHGDDLLQKEIRLNEWNDQTLGKWFEADLNLHLRQGEAPQNRRLQFARYTDLETTLKETGRIRRFYQILEVLVPVLFAFSAVLIVHHRPEDTPTRPCGLIQKRVEANYFVLPMPEAMLHSFVMIQSRALANVPGPISRWLKGRRS